jgi:hypothetical protein
MLGVQKNHQLRLGVQRNYMLETFTTSGRPPSASRLPDRVHFLFPDADADAGMIGLALTVLSLFSFSANHHMA